MAMIRAKWFLTGVPVGFWWGWKKSSEWELEAMVESVLPRPVARHVVDFLPKGTAEARHKARLEESIRDNARKQEETIRKQDEALRRMEATSLRQEHTIGLLHAVIARLQEADDQRLVQKQGSPSPTTTTAPPSPPKQ
ncbi:uncharacterized protein LOC123411834 isoform X3 [Hordeum vulgare subsp. vulgare]|uniref:Uncharacterized protein n=1 Tax=Hordeum vulgare subsp. vulgare TaxID=112509 RepID=A0A8I6WJE8_HORVV|nr:uncharacterized protein LOC123411834 isoform X3 [Hordeum vulgare subsp. vulgare]KAI5018090.1 hypothetical protein ZWY2020_042978 [Hordeum vulgare]